MTPTAKLLLLGSGELGREFVIAAKRLGCAVIACDSYAGAPAMQVADAAEVFDMLDGARLRAVIDAHAPDFVVPEIEAIRTEVLAEVEAAGVKVVPSARAARLTMNRDAIRDRAAELGLRTSAYRYAESLAELVAGAEAVGLPCVVKPVMSSSGKGQSVVRTAGELAAAWDYAVAGMRGDRVKVIVEGFIAFDSEITLLTVRTREGTVFAPPIGHVQEAGDYRESWAPHAMDAGALTAAETMARTITDDLGGYGLFGVEFFVCGDGVVFSELSPRPHDTGMATLLGFSLNEFELHARAVLGLPVPAVTVDGAVASAVLLADRHASAFRIGGLAAALASDDPAARLDVRVFGKPVTRPGRRMAVALAQAPTVERARDAAKAAAARLRVEYS